MATIKDTVSAVRGTVSAVKDDSGSQQLMQGRTQKGLAQKILPSIDEVALAIADSVQNTSESISNTLIQEDKFTQLASLAESAVSAMDSVTGGMEQLSQGMSEINRRVATMVADALQVTQSINDTTQRAVDHSRVMQNLSKTVAEGEKQMQNVISVINVLYESVDAIKDAIAAINDISDQTNLLAMNAAIEAAHAGKAGLGFAVVAGEIRKLSAVTRADSANIEKTLKGMMETLSTVQKAANESRNSMKMIESQTSKTMEVFSSITEEMSSLSSKTGQMNDINNLTLSDVQMLLENTKSNLQNVGQIGKNNQEYKSLMKAITDRTSSIAEIGIKNIKSEGEIIDALLEAEKAANAIVVMQEGKAPFPFARVLLGHLLWVIRVRELISGKSRLNATDIPDSHNCLLGKWIDSTTKNMPVHGLSSFSQLATDHEALHSLVINIFKNISRMDREEKEKQYAQIVEKSKLVIGHLQRLRDAGGF